MCKDVFYNSTKLPNHLNQSDQTAIGLEVNQYFPLIQINCSPYMLEFLCSMYAPPCTQANVEPPRPCKSLCQAARGGCEILMNKFGFDWPQSFNCDTDFFDDTVGCITGNTSNGRLILELHGVIFFLIFMECQFNI